MDVLIPLLAAVAASGFAIDLSVANRRRPRPHAAMWAAAMAMYALATWALVIGLSSGWSGTTFRLFYWLGAVANIPFLAAGSVYLVLGGRTAQRFLTGVIVWSIAGGVVTWLAPLTSGVGRGGVPEGSELFAWTVELGGFSIPGPRVFAALAGGIATLVIVGLAGMTAARFWNSNRTLATGNLLIVLGTLAPASGGSLTALGEAAGFAVALLVGAVLLWSGYRVAAAARRPATAGAT
jgi:hypothetical protein